jgi:hypothetical protein
MMDSMTEYVQNIRNMSASDNIGKAAVGHAAKFMVPFLETPMRILKQGIEYTPLAMINKPGQITMEQTGKAMVGSLVMAGTAIKFWDHKITWAEPTDPRERTKFWASGRKPYSVRVGDHWVSYKYAGPIGYPMALVGALRDKYEHMESRTGDKFLTEFVPRLLTSSVRFFGDLPYVQNFGSAIDALSGDPKGWTKFAANIPRQLIPYVGLQGWIDRMADKWMRDPETFDEYLKQNSSAAQELFGDVPKMMKPFSIPTVGAKTKMFKQIQEPIPAPPQAERVLGGFIPIKPSPVNRIWEESYRATVEEGRRKRAQEKRERRIGRARSGGKGLIKKWLTKKEE